MTTTTETRITTPATPSVTTRFTARVPSMPRLRRMSRAFAIQVASVALGAIVFGIGWEIATVMSDGDLPGPIATMKTMVLLLSDPFFDRGPNDKGIGIQVGASLWRVFLGFALGTLAAIPLGVLLGASTIARRIFDPIVQMLRPISPLAWFPIGLVVMKSAPNAAIFVVFITCLWPTVINTAFGVASVSQSHRNVAKVFEFSPPTYFWKVLLPSSLPHVFVGLRLSLGIAWVVIVAAEMLSGGTGIGFYVWDAWNALDLQRVIAAILCIGAVGLALDRGMSLLASRFEYPEVP